MTEILNDDIQNGVLFFMLTDTTFMSICRPKIEPKIFKSSIQQQICKIVLKFWDDYKAIINDKATEIILPYFDENEQNVVASYLHKLFTETFIKNYIFDKLDLFISKREWESVLIQSVEDLDKNDITKIEDRVRKILSNKIGYNNLKNILEEDLKEFYDTSNDGVLCCPTGVKALDEIIEGLKYKELTIIMAPLNVGKSFFLVFIGSKALLYSKDVLYITNEMSKQQVKGRFFQRFAGVTKKPSEELEIWSGNERIKYKADHLGNAKKVKNSIDVMRSFGGKLYIAEYPDKTLSINKFEALINDIKLTEKKYPDLILLDNLQGIRYNTNGKDDWKNLEDLSHELRRIAMEKNIAIVTSTHSSRSAIGNKIVQAQDIRGSIDILNIADLGISISQTNEEYLLGQARLFIMRARSSKKWGQIRIYQNYEMGHFCVFSEKIDN